MNGGNIPCETYEDFYRASLPSISSLVLVFPNEKGRQVPSFCCRAMSTASGGKSGLAAAAQHLVRQGLSLGLVGLATGSTGSAAAHRLLGPWHASAERAVSLAEPVSGHSVPTTQAAFNGNVCSAPGSASGQRRQCQQPAPVLQSALQRAAFMSVSANLRYAALYAAEDWLPAHVLGPMQLRAARAVLHGANVAMAALQWQWVSQHIYD